MWDTLRAPGSRDISSRLPIWAVIVDQRRRHDAPVAGGEQLVLHPRPVRIRLEVLDEEGPPLQRRPLVDRAGEVGEPQMGRVREDAGVLELRAEVEAQHAVALDGGHAQLELRPPKEGAELVPQPLESRGRNDGFFFNEVAFDRGEHLGPRNLDGLEHPEAPDDEGIGGQELGERLRVGDVGADRRSPSSDSGGTSPTTSTSRKRRLMMSLKYRSNPESGSLTMATHG